MRTSRSDPRRPPRCTSVARSDVARQIGDSTLTAVILNNRGNLLVTQQKNAEAIAAYKESAALAKQVGQRLLRARALTNAASGSPSDRGGPGVQGLAGCRLGRASRTRGDPGDRLRLDQRGARLPRPPPITSGFGGSTLAPGGGCAHRGSDFRPTRSAIAGRASYAWGYLGGLYEAEQRNAEALELTRRAVLAAQQVNAPESLYRWQWQTGRLLKKLGAADDAIASYRTGGLYAPVDSSRAVDRLWTSAHVVPRDDRAGVLRARGPAAPARRAPRGLPTRSRRIWSRHGRPSSCSRWPSCATTSATTAWTRRSPRSRSSTSSRRRRWSCTPFSFRIGSSSWSACRRA